MSDFVHLHLHTEYSLLDGAVRLKSETAYTENNDKGEPEDKTKPGFPLCEALIKRGMTAAAITDHGNLYGVHTFVSAMRKNKLKPIIGSEFYVTDDMYVKTPEVLHKREHLILLAKNQKGYENLMRLSTESYVDGFYMKPRIDLRLLEKYSEGLICCSACLAGHIPSALLRGDYEDAKAYALRLKGMFAEGDFYIELQDHGLEGEKRILNQLVALARDIGVKVVATNDVHYIEREDADTQDTMMCITLQCKKTEKVGVRFENDNFYLKSGEEMEELFSWIPEAIASTKEIADNLQKQGAFIEGVRPGNQTAEYLGKTINRLNLFGALALGLIAMLPFLTDYVSIVISGMPIGLSLSGTGLLIVVTVALENLRQLNSRALMATYDEYK